MALQVVAQVAEQMSVLPAEVDRRPDVTGGEQLKLHATRGRPVYVFLYMVQASGGERVADDAPQLPIEQLPQREASFVWLGASE